MPRPLARAVVVSVAAVALALSSASCRSLYYSAWEMVGQEKRDLLRSSLSSMVDDQKEAGQAFTTALERVKALTQFDGGDLEREYDRLKGSYDDAQSSAKAIDDRIAEIERVASDLFEEWNREIGEIQSADLKAGSRRKLAETRARYDRAHASMVESRGRMEPALTLLRDHVLYLKHNLNAAAVGSLTESMAGIERSVSDLQASLEASIREAQSFLRTME